MSSRIDDERIKNHLDRVVRGGVEKTLTSSMRKPIGCAMRSAMARQDTRAGYYERNL
jgi:hypothetical protein